MATAVMDSFKTSFAQALNSSPSAMCESCPLRQLHLLCQNIDGVPTQVAQSRIQECLSQLSEADYNCIMSEYKLSEHADHEFTQLVVLVSLIREHLQKKQQEHVHPITTSSSTTTTSSPSSSSSAPTGDDSQNTKNQPSQVKPGRLSKLERAKMALTSSFDNLRKGSGSGGKAAEKRQRGFGKSLTTDDTPSLVSRLAKEDRRASLDPKLQAERQKKKGKMALERSSSAKVPALQEGGGGDSSGGEEMGGGGRGGRSRTGSWLQRFRSTRSATAGSSQDEDSDGELAGLQKSTDAGDENRQPSPVSSSSSPQERKKEIIKPALKLERFENKEESPLPPVPLPPTSPLAISEKFEPTPLQPSQSPPSSLRLVKFKTPSHIPILRKSDSKTRRSHTRAAFSLPPNDGSSQTYNKYRRDHKRSESMSWRHEIFESVTPVKEKITDKSSFQDWEIIEPASFDQLGQDPAADTEEERGGVKEEEEMMRRRRRTEKEEGRKKLTPRERWQRAIEQQIMLQRMEKQNLSNLKANTEADIKRLKLCYRDPSIDNDAVNRKWAELLSRPHPPEYSELKATILEGVTPARRGETWCLLAQQYQERHPRHPPLPPLSLSHSLTQLCQINTDFENAILIDLGRTFPSLPYFNMVGRGGGQDSLASVLHGYAVSDEETGYCQGLSFTTGMILMHTKDEETAYQLLCQMMYIYSYRDVYSRDLSVLQIRLYQLSRLLHDVLPTLHTHLGMNEITPFYYAAPWFLTLFSSQFPIAFVARVMDLFFLDGPDIVFKVAVALLRYYEAHILKCTTMETISDFLKQSMPQLVLNHMSTILDDAHHMELESKLQNFETEYFVLEELTTSFSVESEEHQDLRSLSNSFRSHNKELIEQLAYCRGVINSLEGSVTSLQETVREQQDAMASLHDVVREQQRRIDRLESSSSLSTSLTSELKSPLHSSHLHSSHPTQSQSSPPPPAAAPLSATPESSLYNITPPSSSSIATPSSSISLTTPASQQQQQESTRTSTANNHSPSSHHDHSLQDTGRAMNHTSTPSHTSTANHASTPNHTSTPNHASTPNHTSTPATKTASKDQPVQPTTSED